MPYMYIPADTFAEIGCRIANRHRRRSKKIELRRFKAYFGCSPERCAQLWSLIHQNKSAKRWVRGGSPQHLMWALLWLKLYNTEEVVSGMAGCDEKTFRKWYWRFVEAIAALKEKTVSKQNCCFFGATRHE